MTTVHYLASALELPEGSFGENATMVPLANLENHQMKGIENRKQKVNRYRTEEKYVPVYESEEDAKGIFIKAAEEENEVRCKF